MKLNPDAVVRFEDDKTLIIQHDARALPIPDESIDLIVTSPPYWGQRIYQEEGTALDGQLGREDKPSEFLAALDECMKEWRRILKPTGSVWVNLGDKYAGSGGGNQDGISAHARNTGLPAFEAPGRYNQESEGVVRKSLLGIPWRFAIRQIDSEWILRAEVIWKKNSLPEPVLDRVRLDHEHWFHFTKEPLYHADMTEIREPAKTTGGKTAAERRAEDPVAYDIENRGAKGIAMHPTKIPALASHPDGRIPGSVWDITSEPIQIPEEVKKAFDLPTHFAAFPSELPRRIILGWSPVGGVVLDPFGGTGTVIGVARKLDRFGIHNDLSESYNRLAAYRISNPDLFKKAEERTWASKQDGLFSDE